MKKFELKMVEVKALNSMFPSDKPLFTIDYKNKKFNWVISRDDSMRRMNKMMDDIIKQEYNPYNDLTPEQRKEYFKRIFG